MLPFDQPYLQQQLNLVNAAKNNQNVHPMLTRNKQGIVKPRIPFAGTISDSTTPSTMSEALANLVWYKAMQEEFQALQHNKT